MRYKRHSFTFYIRKCQYLNFGIFFGILANSLPCFIPRDGPDGCIDFMHKTFRLELISKRMFPFCLFQLKVTRVHLRTRGDIADGPATHDSEQGIPSDKLHAATVFQRPPYR